MSTIKYFFKAGPYGFSNCVTYMLFQKIGMGPWEIQILKINLPGLKRCHTIFLIFDAISVTYSLKC